MKTTLRNNMIILAVVSVVLLALARCGTSALKATPTSSPSAAVQQSADVSAAATDSVASKTFTADELAKFDGKNGNPAYIAVDGTVYDVSNVRQWKDGMHAGRFQAGRDYTAELSQAPHGKDILNGVPKVGTYSK